MNEQRTSRNGPGLVASVAGCSLAAMVLGGLIMYPFHAGSWAGWVWAGLATALGPVFVVAVERLGRSDA